MYLYHGSPAGFGESSKHKSKSRRQRPGNTEPLSMPKAESAPPPPPLVKVKPLIRRAQPPISQKVPSLAPPAPVAVAPTKSEALPKELLMATGYATPTPQANIVPTNAPSTIVAPPVMPFFFPPMRVAPVAVAPAPMSTIPISTKAAVVASLSPTSVTPQQARVGLTSTAAALALMLF